jgi:hypothetical protein
LQNLTPENYKKIINNTSNKLFSVKKLDFFSEKWQLSEAFCLASSETIDAYPTTQLSISPAPPQLSFT